MRSAPSTAEIGQLDSAIARARGGELVPALLENDDAGLGRWYWRLEALPDNNDSRYLYHLLADNSFQEGVKNYRDLAALASHLEDWRAARRRRSPTWWTTVSRLTRNGCRRPSSTLGAVDIDALSRAARRAGGAPGGGRVIARRRGAGDRRGAGPLAAPAARSRRIRSSTRRRTPTCASAIAC